ncbi:PEP/pyruvate-binding domain-containing protein [Clostridium coskatii]|uniref:Phosphoenolpyruvate synthase n=1 Tax=Clostridium coskatii TaxID=1705578 RepID=A0A166U388_9CLOT|nr:PEP/pyruvate-binding domain-containing protein [Clostridium coskatii]OAA94518.1 Phosphoenolpyruvate synthase [Clostridium coskatii]OBR93262.1 phosphoenolpyruvate synthase [Clostridium coskatii]
MKYLLNWKEAFESGVSMVGGKGWNLGRLDQYGFNIPQGGVLTAKAYNEYIKYNELQKIIDEVVSATTLDNLDEVHVKDKLNQLNKKIISGSIPPAIIQELSTYINSCGKLKKSWALRSSAVAEDSEKASFAGIHDSFLNVCSLEDILSAVKGCYASLWSPRAVSYRKKMNISDDDVKAAVVVMEMVEAKAAGVGFTCDILSGRQDVIVINANFGLGESVVSGAVEPDTYYLEVEAVNASPHLISRKIGHKQGMVVRSENGGTQFIKSEEMSLQQVLQDKKIEKLGRLLLRVFDALGNGDQHQDVEWVYDGHDFVLVQARPITTIPRKTFPALKNQPDIWSNGNYRDAVPMVQSPLNRRLMKNIIDTMHQGFFTGVDYDFPEGLQFSRFFNGRLYCNISVQQWGNYDAMGALPQGFGVFWGGHQKDMKIDDPDPYGGVIGLKRKERVVKNMDLVKQGKENSAQTWSQITASVKSITSEEFSKWTDQDFINKYNELGSIVKGMAKEFMFLSAAGSMPVMYLLNILTEYFSDKALVVINALIVGGTADITSADQGYRLVEMAELARKDSDAVKYFNDANFDPMKWEVKLPESSPFKKAFHEFIQEYGHRAVYELDIINPRWREDPSYLLGIIRSTINTADIGRLKKEQKEKLEQVWGEIKEKVPTIKHSEIRKLVKECQDGAAVREKNKSVLALIMDAYRIIARELGHRFYERSIIKEPDDVFFCTWPELFSVLSGEWDGRGLQFLIAARKEWKKKMELLAPPDVIYGETPKFTELVIESSSNCLTGIPVAVGKAAGLVRRISNPNDGGRLQPGEVMVAPSTDPGWTPLFLKAGAVVMETGGFLSHGAIVAREYGIPAVVNVPGVMGMLKDGQKIVVDGDKGKIFLVDEGIE